MSGRKDERESRAAAGQTPHGPEGIESADEAVAAAAPHFAK